jgi:hypothetical protein
VKVAALQETKLTLKSRTPVFQNYTLVRKDRSTGRGGGLAFLIHQSVRFTDLDVSSLLPQNDQVIELQGITVFMNNAPINIYNIYIPPASAHLGYSPDIKKLLEVDGDTFILGDLNAHHFSWSSNLSDDRGDCLAQQIEDSDYFILNSSSQTRFPIRGNSSSPDVSLVSSHLALAVNWSTNVALNSDHLPIGIKFEDELPPIRNQSNRTYVNFKKAKWGLWTSEIEAAFADIPDPTTCSAGEKIFSKTLCKASGHHIPAGFREDFKPGLPREAVDLTKERDRLRELDPLDPEITRLNALITETIRIENKKEWLRKVEDSSFKVNPEKGWRLLRALSGKRPKQAPNQPIKFGDKKFSKPEAIAARFCRQYTSVSSHKASPRSRKVKRRLKNKHRLDTSFTPFTPELTKAAILRSSNSTALGPDGLTSLHLKHLGPRAISYMTKIFNLSIAHANIPAIWKRANIVPIPKPGKAADSSMGYRPISLLSPVIKILERLLLPYLTESFPSAPTQHGYRPFRSTITALLPVATKISIGFNEAKPASRTGMVSIDIAKAFDSIDHDLLLEKVTGTNLHSNIVRWLATYLRGRTAVCIW